jgi:hypothetical protein
VSRDLGTKAHGDSHLSSGYVYSPSRSRLRAHQLFVNQNHSYLWSSGNFCQMRPISVIYPVLIQRSAVGLLERHQIIDAIRRGHQMVLGKWYFNNSSPSPNRISFQNSEMYLQHYTHQVIQSYFPNHMVMHMYSLSTADMVCNLDVFDQRVYSEILVLPMEGSFVETSDLRSGSQYRYRIVRYLTTGFELRYQESSDLWTESDCYYSLASKSQRPPKSEHLRLFQPADSMPG